MAAMSLFIPMAPMAPIMPDISIITPGAIMAELAALFIILLAPVITIVRTSGGSASSWSSGIAAKFYGLSQFLIYEMMIAYSTYNDIRFQYICQFSELTSAMTVRLP
jgi:hypothetical protein